MKRRNFWVRCAALLMAGVLLVGCGKKQELQPIDAKEAGGIGGLLASGADNEPIMSRLSTEDEEKPKSEWADKYDHYFEEHPLTNKVMEIETEEQGLKIFIRFAFGQTDDLIYIRYAVWEGDVKTEFDTTVEENYVTAYFLASGEAYIETVMKGRKTEYQQTSGMAWSDMGSISKSENPMGLGDATLEGIVYDGEETIDGVIYDKIYTKALMQTASKANRWVKHYFYVNRETQEVERYQLRDFTTDMNCYFKPLDMTQYLEVPEEMKKGKKVKMEEFAARYGLAIVKITYNSMGIDPNKLNLESALGLK